MKKTRRIILTALLALSITVGTAGAASFPRPSVQEVISCAQNPQECLARWVQWLKSFLPQLTPPQEKPETPDEVPVVPEEKPEAPEETPIVPEEKPVLPDEKPETPEEAPSSLHAFEKRVGELVNIERAKVGLKPLTLDESLSWKARVKSEDMAKNNYFSHNSPTYGTPFEMMQSMGISYRTAGENIAMGQSTPEAVVEAWMNSEGHRKNILSPSFTHLGVGYIADGNYWTQWFIG
ncbi:MAG: hypothetical protein J6K84_03760 [Oscillospiraceae bacterium]|nr:hypothetical protein [Oscillospiraceae bacterium]